MIKNNKPEMNCDFSSEWRDEVGSKFIGYMQTTVSEFEDAISKVWTVFEATEDLLSHKVDYSSMTSQIDANRAEEVPQ